MFLTLLLLVVPLAALGLVLGMGRLEESLLQAPTAQAAPTTTPAPAAQGTAGGLA